MASAARDFNDIPPVHPVADPNGTTEICLREAVLRGGLQALFSAAPSSRIEDGGVKNERPNAQFREPTNDLARVPGVQKTLIAPLPPVDLDPDALPDGKGGRELLQQTAEGFGGIAGNMKNISYWPSRFTLSHGSPVRILVHQRPANSSSTFPITLAKTSLSGPSTPPIFSSGGKRSQ